MAENLENKDEFMTEEVSKEPDYAEKEAEEVSAEETETEETAEETAEEESPAAEESAEEMPEDEVEGEPESEPEDEPEEVSEEDNAESDEPDYAEEEAEEVSAEETETEEESEEDAAARRDMERRRRLARHFANRRSRFRISYAAPERKMSEHSKAAAALLNAKTKHQPLEIVIGGLEPMRTKARIYEDQPVADYHGWKIIIPRTEFIPDYVESTYPGEEQKDRENRYLYSAIGIKADIIPQSFLPEQSICIASRLEAMQVKRDQYWFATESVKDRATKEVHMEYALREGKRIDDARVINVTRSAVFVEIYGVETIIPSREVSWIHIDNCKSMYAPGDTVSVILLDVDRDEETLDVTYHASIKDAYPDPREDAFRRVVRYGKYKGVVSMINFRPEVNTSSGAFVRLMDSQTEVLCAYPREIPVEIGDNVTITITRKDEKTKRMWGKIDHLERKFPDHD